MMRHITNSLRLLAILAIFVRYDLYFLLAPFPTAQKLLKPLFWLRKPALPARDGMRLALALRAIGPTFIKFGQSLSTRADIVGDDIAQDLADLRDNLPPFPTPVAKNIIEQEFQTPLSQLYRDFADQPVAAASIAQVYFARTHEGRPVAVKILRPGIEQAFMRDIRLLYWLAEWVENSFPATRRLKPLAVVQTFDQSVRMELDLRLEAAAATELKQNMREDPGFTVPEVYWMLTSRRVLTLQRIEGIPIHDIAALNAANHDTSKLLEQAAGGFFQQVFRDGFFHADPHPGNLFVEANGNVAVVDFGIMGRLDLKSRIYVAEILHGFLNENYARVADVHFAAGYVPAHQSKKLFEQACMAISKPIMGKPLNEISVAQLLAQLFKVTEQFEMETQPQLLLLQKTMMVAEGVGRMLNPNVNMWTMAEPLIAQWAGKYLSPPARVKMAGEEFVQQLKRLPAIMDETEIALKRINSGLLFDPRTLQEMDNQRWRYHRMWLFFAWTALVFAIFAAIAQLN